MKRLMILLACLMIFGVQPLLASENEEKAIDMVKRTVAMAQSEGIEKTFQSVNDPNGQFVDGELYVFIQNNEGYMLAHGTNPGLVGKNLINLRDSTGVEFVKNLIEQAKKGPGWVDYKWTNPTTKKVQEKTSYVEAIPGTEYFAGCGFYK